MSMTLKHLTEGRRVCKGILMSRILIFFYIQYYLLPDSFFLSFL